MRSKSTAPVRRTRRTERAFLWDSLGIFVGFASFFIMEKTLRVLGGDEEGAGHSHSHSHSPSGESTNGSSTSVSVAGDASGLKLRGSDQAEGQESAAAASHEDSKSPAQTSKLSAYLNLFGDFVHNM